MRFFAKSLGIEAVFLWARYFGQILLAFWDIFYQDGDFCVPLCASNPNEIKVFIFYCVHSYIFFGVFTDCENIFDNVTEHQAFFNFD